MKIQTSNLQIRNKSQFKNPNCFDFKGLDLGVILKFEVGILKLLILVLFLIIISSHSYADDISPSTSILGFYENTLVGVFPRSGEALGGDLNRTRLRVDSELAPNIRLHLEPEYNLLVKSGNIPVTGVSELDKLIWDRAYIQIYFPAADLTVGRQRIAWGTGYLWNPTDIFNPFTLSFAVDEEQESEPEAVRLEVPIGAAGVVDSYVVAGNKWEETKKGIRVKTNMGLYDLSASFVDLGSGSYQLGFDTAGELFDVGVKSEIVLISSLEAEGYFQSVWGWNYTLENGWGIDMEYFFNGWGRKNKADYDWGNYLAGNIKQVGMDYLYLGLNNLLDEITAIRFSLILNANDMGYIFYPSYTRNIFQQIDLSLEAMLVGGEEGSEYKPSGTQDPSGLIGSNLILIRTRYNF